jgi:GT2 family glycosyltransferase
MLSNNKSVGVEHFITLFDNNFLPIGLCLHASLLEHGQPFHLWILCMDELAEQNLQRLALPHVSLIPLREAEDARLLAVKPTRSRGEYCWTLTPFTPQFVFDRDTQVDRVTYLDADLFFFAPPKLLLDEFDRSGKHVLITDHAYDPRYERSGRAKRGGRFCVQFMTFRRTPEGEKVMHWWQDRCLEWCYARVEDGKFGDQKYLDQWPEIFEPEVHILLQKEKTLAPWNVANFEKLGGGKLNPVFYHFQTLRIISPDEILLYSGWRVGKASAALYQAYVDCLRNVVSRMKQEDIPVACLPRRKDLIGRLVTLKHKYIDGEQSVPVQSYVIKSIESPSCQVMPVETGKVEGGGRISGKMTKQSMPALPLVSIVTVVYNGAATLEHTIRSVIEQTYENVEYIVIDGGSSDATVDILRKYESSIDYWVSEKDAGIYDAMNKGISLASGEIVGLINADDFYASPDVLARVVSVLADPDLDACYGDLCYVKQYDTSSVVRYWQSSEFRPGAFESAWCPPHPTFFVRRKIYERSGVFDLTYKIAADMELMLRFLELCKVRAKYIPEVLVKMRIGGTTNRSLTNIIKQNAEILRALRQSGQRASMLRLTCSKVVSKGLQFFVRPK